MNLHTIDYKLVSCLMASVGGIVVESPGRNKFYDKGPWKFTNQTRKIGELCSNKIINKFVS